MLLFGVSYRVGSLWGMCLGRWLKEGKDLVDQKKYLMQSDARSGILTFTILNPVEADLGFYECEVKLGIYVV